MICGSGGAQTIALREVYHFISAQQRYLKHESRSGVLDGDECSHKIHFFLKIIHKQIFMRSQFG